MPGQVIEECEEVLPLLPPLAKACLLAFCRRADGGALLTDQVLTLLADESWTFLDLHGAAGVTEAGLAAVTQACPALQVYHIGLITLHLCHKHCTNGPNKSLPSCYCLTKQPLST